MEILVQAEDDLKPHVTQLTRPRCRLAELSRACSDNLLHSIGKAHAQIQERRGEYARLPVDQPQTAALTSIQESMEAVKEAVEQGSALSSCVSFDLCARLP